MQNQLTAVPVWGAAVHVQTDMTGLVLYWRRRDDSLAGSGAVRSFYLCRRWISGCLFVMDADMRDAACCRCTHHDTPSVSSFSKREKSCDASSVFEAKEIFSDWCVHHHSTLKLLKCTKLCESVFLEEQMWNTAGELQTPERFLLIKLLCVSGEPAVTLQLWFNWLTNQSVLISPLLLSAWTKLPLTLN